MADLFEGKDKIEDWDDEELYRGRRRNKNGQFVGSDPKVVPAEAHRELVRRQLSWAKHEFAHSLPKAIACLVSIIESPLAEPGDKIKASSYIIDRVLGKAPERIDMTIGIEAPWQQVMRLAIVPDESDIVDGVVVEDDPVLES